MSARHFKFFPPAVTVLITLMFLFTTANLGTNILAQEEDEDENGAEVAYMEDINEDGETDVSDAIALLLRGLEDPDDPEADYNGDGEFNVLDVVSLLINIRDGNLTPLPTFPLIGRVLESGQGLAGVEFSIVSSEGFYTRVASDTAGMFRVDGLREGTYIVMPIIRTYYYTVLPDSVTVTIEGDSVIVPDFQATLADYTMSGRVLEDSTGLAEVTVSIKGIDLDTTLITDANGKFRIEHLLNARYAVVPQKENYTFTPYSLSVEIDGDSVVVPDIKASPVGPETPALYKLGGRVFCTVQPLINVTLVLIGDVEASTVTDANGFYMFLVPNGEYMIFGIPIPELQVFNPTSTQVTVNGQDVVNVDFYGFGAGGGAEGL
ncbi:MAG TPA: SpaA isopeptide-forming pilin-related protein [archaeon]|nr:SpaA isopeptide-forming pilin-related protein [archaeon]